jgi:transposase
MAPQFVKPYVKANKNDVADAEAICEAVGRPNMRFVPIKSIEQQGILSVHRVRQGFVKARTAQANQIRGLLGEFGLVIPKGICHVARCVPALLEDASNELPLALRQLIDRHLKDLDQQVRELERQIIAWHRAREDPRHRVRPLLKLLASAIEATSAVAASGGIGLARPRAATELERWQVHAPRDQQTRRRLPAHAADPRGSLGHLDGKTPEWEQECLARQPTQPATPQHRRRGVGQ